MANDPTTEHAVDSPGRGHDHVSVVLLPFGVTSDEHRFEPVTIAAPWAHYSTGEREAGHRAALWLCDPRAVVRFICVWNLDPEQVLAPGGARKVN